MVLAEIINALLFNRLSNIHILAINVKQYRIQIITNKSLEKSSRRIHFSTFYAH